MVKSSSFPTCRCLPTRSDMNPDFTETGAVFYPEIMRRAQAGFYTPDSGSVPALGEAGHGF
uniref:Uncharacterized protein n=1 Tax=Romanomermis culicivorax TaxID=13658 RepID=A0A915K2V6_ROMCU